MVSSILPILRSAYPILKRAAKTERCEECIGNPAFHATVSSTNQSGFY